MRDGIVNHRPLLALLLLAPIVSGCSGASDLLSKDAEWFSRPGRTFVRNVSIETPPLTPTKTPTNDDLVSASGSCAGMAQGAANANALADSSAGGFGSVALGHTECDVVRGLGAPDNVDISNNPRGDRVAVITYSRGSRAGIYTFTSGRLSSVEAGPEPVAQQKAARKKK